MNKLRLLSGALTVGVFASSIGIKEFKSRYDEVNQNIISVEHSINNSKAATGRALQNLADYKEALRQRTEEANTLREQLAAAQSQAESSQEAANKLSGQVAELTQQLEAAEQAKQTLESKVSQLEAQVEQLQTQKGQAVEEAVAEANKQIDKANNEQDIIYNATNNLKNKASQDLGAQQEPEFNSHNVSEILAGRRN